MSAILDVAEAPIPEATLLRQRVGFGFYLYLLSDGILFASLFAAFAVLRHATDGGPDGHQMLGVGNAFIETACLLTSSFTCGLAMLASDRRRVGATLLALGATVALGMVFLGLELHEFGELLAAHAGPARSASWSAFFALVGTHGLHVTAGLVWVALLMVQMATRGITDGIERRLVCFSLFWHVLDIVWIGVFTFVYLVGARL
jgi:cytochrome o ubiquinol oxidase subunit III